MGDGIAELGVIREKNELSDWKFSASSKPKREDYENQDACSDAEAARRGVFVVCDGLSGQAHGALAARTATSELVNKLIGLPENCTEADIQKAFREASEKIDKVSGYGATTAAAVVIKGSNVFMASVGDSTVGVIRGEKMIKLNEDLDVLDEVKTVSDLNKLSLSDRIRWSRRHGMDNVLGRGFDANKVRVNRPDLKKGDILVLETDGVFDNLTPLEQADSAGYAVRTGLDISGYLVDKAKGASVWDDRLKDDHPEKRVRQKLDDTTLISVVVGEMPVAKNNAGQVEAVAAEAKPALEPRRLVAHKALGVMVVPGDPPIDIVLGGSHQVFKVASPGYFGFGSSDPESSYPYLLVSEPEFDRKNGVGYSVLGEKAGQGAESTVTLGIDSHKGFTYLPGASRTHVKISVYNGNVMATDLGSTNGTEVRAVKGRFF